MSMRSALSNNKTEVSLTLLTVVMCIFLSIFAPSFFSIVSLIDILNTSSINIIFAVGLLVVLIAGGVDISFTMVAAVAQYVVVSLLMSIGGGNWALGFAIVVVIGIALSLVNAALIQQFRIISIIVTISTYNIYLGLLFSFSKGEVLIHIPYFLEARTAIFEMQLANGDWLVITPPVVVMVLCVIATWLFLSYSAIGRQLFALGDNPEGARRLGINVPLTQFVAYGWLGMLCGTAGLMHIQYTGEVVPNAMIGRELDVLAAAVLGGARLGGGRGSVFGCVLGVLLMSITQNGLNLLGVSPFAFRMVVGLVILVAITASSIDLRSLRPKMS
jgi:simple sugar transport system permease protein